MTNEEKAQLAFAFGGLAEIYGKAPTRAALTVMVDALADLPFEGVSLALRRWTQTERGFPTPADIRARLGVLVRDEDIGREVAARILSAVSKFGYTNPDRAKEAIGELGWLTVERWGGWVQLCQSLTNDGIPSYTAQLRDLAITLHRKASTGTLDHPPAIPQSNRTTSQLTSLADTLKQIPKIGDQHEKPE